MRHYIHAALPVLLAGLLSTQTVHAHDFWIEPSNFEPSLGEVVTLTLKIRDHFIGTPFPRDPYHVTDFVVWDASRQRTVGGIPGRSPAGWFDVETEGVHIVGYRSRHTTLQMEADAFEAYLAGAGLNRIIRTRTEKGESTDEGREAYARFAKSLIACGSTDGAGYDRELGFALEIVPQRNPHRIVRGNPLPARILLDGSPLSGIKVAAIHEEDMSTSSVSETDATGSVELHLDREGVWMITAIHMRPALTRLDADWESLWASLTVRASFQSTPR